MVKVRLALWLGLGFSVVVSRDSSGARLCVNAAPTCQKAHHFLPRVP